MDVLDIAACSQTNVHLSIATQLYLERAQFQSLSINAHAINKLKKNRNISALNIIEIILRNIGPYVTQLTVDLAEYDQEGTSILAAIKKNCSAVQHFTLINGLRIENWSANMPVFTELETCSITKCSDALSDEIMCKFLEPSANTLTSLSLDNVLAISGTFLHSLLNLKKLSIKVQNHYPYEHQALFENIKEYLQVNDGQLVELELCNSGPNNLSALYPYMVNMQKLRLQGFALLNNDPDFERIADLPNLTSLSLILFHSTEVISNEKFAALIKRLAIADRLTELIIHLSYRQKLEFTPNILGAFRFTNLQHFALKAPLMQRLPFDPIYNQLNSSVNNMIRLNVDIFRVSITQICSNLPNLQILSINCFHLTGLDGPVILPLNQLIRFKLFIWPKTPPKLNELLNALRANNLESLHITVPRGTVLAADTIRVLTKFPKLRDLSILGGIWNDECFTELMGCKQIQDFGCNNIDDPKKVIFGGMKLLMDSSKTLRKISIFDCSENFKSYFDNVDIPHGLDLDLQLAERRAISF